MSARTDQIQHGPIAARTYPVHALLGVLGLTAIIAPPTCWFWWRNLRADAWAEAASGRLVGMNRAEIETLRGQPDPAPAIAGWDMTFTRPFWIESDQCLAIRFDPSGRVAEWSEFTGDTTLPDPVWRPVRAQGSHR